MTYATHDMPLMQKHYIDDDMDICQLLKTMNLSDTWSKKPTDRKIDIAQKIRSNIEGEMGDGNIKSAEMLELPSNPALRQEKLPCGCAYLRAVRHQLEWATYPTTGGEYLDAIFTHREILFSQPAAHRDCARAFSDLASILEKREWRSDRDADPEAVAAFRHEAWVVASVG